MPLPRPSVLPPGWCRFIVLIFLLLVSFIFWLAHLGTQGHAEEEALLQTAGVAVYEAEPAAGGDGQTGTA